MGARLAVATRLDSVSGSRPAAVDAVVLRDPDGLPYEPTCARLSTVTARIHYACPVLRARLVERLG